ncbi:hypothetical protein KC357_g82 [Hortaea werneckii]|nr:hypothetical protein KC357_g82 [Hortaea werneckii]
MCDTQSFHPLRLASRVSCLTARSLMISSEPPPTTIIRRSLLCCSTGAPGPPRWYPAPPRTCCASLMAISWIRPAWTFANAIRPAISGSCHPFGLCCTAMSEPCVQTSHSCLHHQYEQPWSYEWPMERQ